MNNRIAPILAWLYGGRLAGADELAVSRRATGLGDTTYRVDKAFDWRQPWHASEASQRALPGAPPISIGHRAMITGARVVQMAA